MKQPKTVLRAAVVFYFVIGLEILIMISPTAGFFYAAFNPFLLSLAQSPATRWLTAFFLRHHTFAMIGDWIFHPFRHLEGGHSGMHHGTDDGMENHGDGNGMARRMIFLHVETPSGRANRADLFGVNVRRSPAFVADVDIHNLVLRDVRDLPPETGWGRVPTPFF